MLFGPSLGSAQSQFSHGFTPISDSSLTWTQHGVPLEKSCGLDASSTYWITRSSSDLDGRTAFQSCSQVPRFFSFTPKYQWHWGVLTMAGWGEHVKVKAAALCCRLKLPLLKKMSKTEVNHLCSWVVGLDLLRCQVKWRYKALNDLHGTWGRRDIPL